jgi:flagellar biosynthesis GTPase FlhF
MRRALRGVHVADKDAASVIVAVTLGERVSVDDCALFFQNAIYRWDHIVIARTVRSTLSDDLAAISSTRQIDWPIIHMPSIELFVAALLRTEAVEAERSEAAEAERSEEVETERREEVEAERREEGEAGEAERSEEVEAERSEEMEAERSEEVEAGEAERSEEAEAVGAVDAERSEEIVQTRAPRPSAPWRCLIGRTPQCMRSSREKSGPLD